MTIPLYSIDINTICEMKGPFYAYLLDTNNVYVACNKHKLDFYRDIFGRTDVIGNTFEELTGKEGENVRSCSAENRDIINSRAPRQYYHTWIIKNNYRLDLLTFKMPVFDEKGNITGILSISHFLNKFSAPNAFKLGFSKRETECLFYLLDGCTAKEIARAINLSPRTVENYIENMKDKLGCTTVSELIIKILQSDIKEDVSGIFASCFAEDNLNPLSKEITNIRILKTIPLISDPLSD